jgi:peptidoglycan/LPS O-acetylase OafA/YrhL
MTTITIDLAGSSTTAPGLQSGGRSRSAAAPARLRYLDGIRGLAASLIVIYHVALRLIETAPKSNGQGYASPQLLTCGHCVVGVFIVLSGYVLMMPVVSADGMLSGGWSGYLRRRARRILPPYYAALGFSLALLLPGFIGWPRLPWRSSAAALDVSATSVAAHLLLVHNLNSIWALQINAPLWSVATEWQIYFLFPLLLLPLWRRARSFFTVVIALLLGISIAWMANGRLDVACPWYIGLFAMGMAAATASFSDQTERVRARNLAWPLPSFLPVAGAMILVAFIAFLPRLVIPIDCVLGLTVMALLVNATNRVISQADSAAHNRHPMIDGFSERLLNFLESPAMVWLGLLSYSLYLMHGPLIVLTDTLFNFAAHPSWTMRLWALPILATLVVLPTTYVFHRLFERPWLFSRERRR